MKKYSVQVEGTFMGNVEVEAPSEDLAFEAAYGLVDAGELDFVDYVADSATIEGTKDES